MKTYECWDGMEETSLDARRVSVEDWEGEREAACKWAERASERQEQGEESNYEVCVRGSGGAVSRWDVFVRLIRDAIARPIPQTAPKAVAP